MNKEYYEMRRALIALLCVGDKIHGVYTNIHMYHYGLKRHGYFDVVETYTVKSITRTSIGIEIAFGRHFAQDMETVFAHEGNLYFWNPDTIGETETHERRLERIIRILNSEDTKFQDNGLR